MTNNTQHQEYAKRKHLFEMLRLVRLYADKKARIDRKAGIIRYSIWNGVKRYRKVMSEREALRIFHDLYGENA